MGMSGRRSGAGLFLIQRTAGAASYLSAAPLPRSLSTTSSPSRIPSRYRPSMPSVLSPVAHRTAGLRKLCGLGQPRHLSSIPFITVASSPLEDIPSSTPLSPDDLSALDPVVDIPHDPLQSAASFLDPLIHPLADALLAFPHPWGYGASIILVTIVLRTMTTLPIAFWQRKRTMRVALHVVPELRMENERAAKDLAGKCRSRGASYEQYQMELRVHMRQAAKELHSKFNANPTVTMWAPLLVHMPIFVTLSLAIRRAIDLPGSPLASEHFWWLEHLGQQDDTWVLPLLGMMVAFSNAELVGSSRRVTQSPAPPSLDTYKVAVVEPEEQARGPAVWQAPASPPARPPQKDTRIPRRGKGETGTSDLFASFAASRQESCPSRPRTLSTSAVRVAWKPPAQRRRVPQRPSVSPELEEIGRGQKRSPISSLREAELKRGFMAYVLRFSSVGFGMIASTMPSGVVLYWVTSMIYSLLQNVGMRGYTRWQNDNAAKKQREAQAALEALGTKTAASTGHMPER